MVMEIVHLLGDAGGQVIRTGPPRRDRRLLACSWPPAVQAANETLLVLKIFDMTANLTDSGRQIKRSEFTT